MCFCSWLSSFDNDNAETDFNGRLFFKSRHTHSHTHSHTQDKTLDDNDNDDNDDADRQKKKKKKRTQRTIKFLLSDIAHTQTQTHKGEETCKCKFISLFNKNNTLSLLSSQRLSSPPSISTQLIVVVVVVIVAPPPPHIDEMTNVVVILNAK